MHHWDPPGGSNFDNSGKTAFLTLFDKILKGPNLNDPTACISIKVKVTSFISRSKNPKIGNEWYLSLE